MGGPTSKETIALGILTTTQAAPCTPTSARDSIAGRVVRRVNRCHCLLVKYAASSELFVVKTTAASKSLQPTPSHKSTHPPQNSVGAQMAVAPIRLLGTMAMAVAATGMQAGHAVAYQMS